MQSKENIIRRRLNASYATSLVSITLVLFLLGLVGILLLNSKKLSDYVRENIGFSVFLENDAREVDILNLQKTLDTKAYVKETYHINKDQAAAEFSQELGEDFIEFLGYNPLPSSIDVKLNASYANPDSIIFIENEIRSFEQVADVSYQKDLLYAVNTNVRKISIAILAFSLLLFFIAIALINNTIRLTVYSRRFIIRTMQLVGAQTSFIMRPFINKGIIQGVIAALLACLCLAATLFLLEKQMSDIFSFLDIHLLIILFISILLTGILISLFSTIFSVNKYLNIKTDSLYT